jgi:anti-sigma28 factor (negative regulator of flagellin synthesis)
LQFLPINKKGVIISIIIGFIMLVHTIAQYQSFKSRSRNMTAKPERTAVSKTKAVDTYEASGAYVPKNQPSSSEIRADLIKTVKKRIGSGFYNSKDVLEDLSNSFAKALHQTIL